MGKPICSLVDNGTPPPAPVTVASIEIKPAVGSVITTKYSDGTSKIETV
jgi:hypothetical protein